jgi:hypothetical protein
MANVGFPQQPQNQPAESPIMGLYLDRPPHMVDPKGFSACNNVRIEFGRVRSDLIGWAVAPFPFTTPPSLPYIYLDGAVSSLNLGYGFGVTPTDLVQFHGNPTLPTYVTPTYTTGTISVNNTSTAVTGLGTRWATDIQFGAASDTIALAAGNSPGDTVITIAGASTVPPTWLTGLPVTVGDAAGAVAPGTYVNNVQSYLGNWAITLSRPLLAS